jgi:hypothetical protein
LVDQFLTGQRVFEYETGEFVSMKHDRELVPGLDTRLARVAQAYGYFTALSFETQGLNDNGSDVSVVYRDVGSNDNAQREVLGFQIKSHTELASKAIVAIIKAQRDDAFRKIPDLAHYYIVLCAYELPLKKRLNAIRAEFLNAHRTTVVSPTQALKFLRLEMFQIDATVKRVLDDSDVVLREMREDLEPLTDTAKALVCFLSATVVGTGTLDIDLRELQSGALARFYERVIDAADSLATRVENARDLVAAFDLGDEVDEIDDLADVPDSTLRIIGMDVETAFAVDLEHLEGDFLLQSSTGTSVTLLLPAARSIVAVAADAMVRYGYSTEELTPYLLAIAGVEQ